MAAANVWTIDWIGFFGNNSSPSRMRRTIHLNHDCRDSQLTQPPNMALISTMAKQKAVKTDGNFVRAMHGSLIRFRILI